MATITRRLERVLDELEQEFLALYTRDDFICQLQELKRAEKTSARPSALARLSRMLQEAGIPFEPGRETSYYELLVQMADLPDLKGVEERLLNALYDRYRAFPRPEEYMGRIVDRLENPADGWGQETLRLRILKRFIGYGEYLGEAGKGGKNAIREYVRRKTGSKSLPGTQEVLDYLDDGVFDALETATKAQKKPEAKYGLLKAADDLASGKFRGGGATRKDLYLFALAYDMRYCAGFPGEEADEARDVEKNLFCDYYTNNLMRFVTDAYRGRLSDFETDPSGRGINYKNFAEMVYLYYMNKELSPAEKIRRSSQMIGEIAEAAFKRGASGRETEAEPAAGMSGRPENKKRGTAFYRDRILQGEEVSGERIFLKNEEAFRTYLLENYQCDTYTMTYMTPKGPVDSRMNELQLESGQETAFAHYREILSGLEALEVEPESCNYGLWFTDLASFRKFGQEDPACQEYLELLYALNSFLGNTVQEEVSSADLSRERTLPSRARTKALGISSPEEVTRTSLLVAYYYYFNALHDLDEDARGKGFGDIFRMFKSGLDGYLIPSGYQPVSGRNIIDVAVIFSSYAFLNE